MERKFEREVLVIGAGVAGLAAARRLKQAGLAPLVLEARERVGGRIVSDYSHGAVVELGAEFVHGANAATWELIREGGLAAEPWEGERRFALGGRLLAGQAEARLRERVFALYDQVTHHEGSDISVEALLAQAAAGQDAAGMFTRRWLAGLEAAEVERLSARWVSQERALTTAGWDNFRLSAGYSQLPALLAAGLEIRLGAAVSEIVWDEAGATVQLADGEQLSARRVIVTVPLSLLQQGRLSFTPALPAAKQAAINAIAMGHVTKLVLWFERAGWGEFQIVSSDGLVSSWWQSGSPAAPALMGYSGGLLALELAALGEQQAIMRGLDEACALFGAELRDHFIGGRLVDWASDPWSLGAYSYTPVGGGGARAVIAAPQGKTLFFAGEATHTGGHVATVHGAIETGWRAAEEVLVSG